MIYPPNFFPKLLPPQISPPSSIRLPPQNLQAATSYQPPPPPLSLPFIADLDRRRYTDKPPPPRRLFRTHTGDAAGKPPPPSRSFQTQTGDAAGKPSPQCRSFQTHRRRQPQLLCLSLSVFIRFLPQIEQASDAKDKSPPPPASPTNITVSTLREKLKNSMEKIENKKKMRD